MGSSEGRSPGQYGQRVYEGILPPWWDVYDVTYPDDVTETYTYSTKDPQTGVKSIKAIITVTFSSSLKDRVISVEKVYHAPGAY